MNKTRMLSFRLDSALLHKVDILRISRHRTRGETIREALEMYFRVYNPVLRPSTDVDTADGQNSRIP